jgi:DNA-binding transcriptional LysR family regulator
MDNLYRIRIFTHICKTLNFTETARQLHLAQPAVSRHIKNLEDELGSHLFIRQKKKVLLTEAGKMFLMEISPLISEFDRIFSGYSDSKAETKGYLKIGSLSEAGQYFFIDHLINFQNKFPNIKIIVEYEGSDYLQKKIEVGELDFALVSRYVASKGLDVIPLFKDRPVLVGPSTKKNIEFVGQKIFFIHYREDDYYAEDFVKRNFSAVVRKKIEVIGSVSSHESMFKWLLKRDAFCIVPYSSYEKSKYKNHLKVFKEDINETNLYLIYLFNSKAELRKKLFLEQMQKIALLSKNSISNFKLED